MKNFKSSSKKWFGKMKKAIVGLSAAVTMASVTSVPVSAVTINSNATTESVVGGILDVVFKIAFYMGFVIAAIGVFSFIMAFKDDNAEQQSRGVRLAIVGAILIGLKVIVQLTGLIS